jgi:hypothetical protein
MSYDLSPAANSTLRLLGNKQYIYNSAATRWERVIAVPPTAVITSNYDGKADGAQIVAGQQVQLLIQWNQPVNTSQFTANMLSLTGNTAALSSFAQDTTDPSLYKANFSFTGALGQVYIPANSVVVNNLKNSVIYSEALAGAYLPYATLRVESYSSQANPVYTFFDPNFSNSVRQFTNNMSGTSFNNVSNRRIKISLINMGANGVAITGTAGLIGSDIVRTSSVFPSPGITQLLVSTSLYTTNNNTTIASATSSVRYADMFINNTYYYLDYLFQLSIPARAYQDISSTIFNVPVSPIYFNRIWYVNNIGIYALMARKSGTNNGVLKIYIDKFGSLVSNVNQSVITLNSGGTLGTLTLTSNTKIDANAMFGNLFVADYTVPAGSTDYTETITIGSNLFTIPPANLSSSTINGIPYTVDPISAGGVLGAQPIYYSAITSSGTSINNNVFRSPVSLTAVDPVDGGTATSGVNLSISLPNRGTFFTNTSVTGIRIYTGNTAANGGNLIYANTTPTRQDGTGLNLNFPINLLSNGSVFTSNTKYYVSIPANQYYDDYGNNSLAYNYSFTMGYFGALTLVSSRPTNGSTDFGATLPFRINLSQDAYSTNTSVKWVLYTGSLGGTVFATGNVSVYNKYVDPENSSNPNTDRAVIIDNYPRLVANTKYYLSIPPGAYSDILHVKNDTFNSSFTTIDQGPLTLTAVSPLDGGTGFNGVDVITLSLNRDAYSTNTSVKWVLYTGSLGGTVFATGSVPSTNRNVSISNYPAMSENTTYYLSIPAGAYTDRLFVDSSAYSFSFTTASASPGDYLYTPSVGYYTTTFKVPGFITSISAVVIAHGGASSGTNSQTYSDDPDYGVYINKYGAPGGGGGGLAYRNNISVTPGEVLTLRMDYYGSVCGIYRNGVYGTPLLEAYSGRYSTFTSDTIGIGGSGGAIDRFIYAGGDGGSGGNMTNRLNTGGSGGGAAGTYYGTGGSGGDGVVSGAGIAGTTGANNSTGGTGASFVIAGQESTTGAGERGTGSSLYGPNDGRKYYGSGGGGWWNGSYAYDPVTTAKVQAGSGGIRIVWGAGRAFPNTNISTSSS